jgi:hypothetical protein
MGSRTVDLNLAVAIPEYNGLEELTGSDPIVRLEIGQAAGTGLSIPDLSVGVVDILPDSTLTLKRPEIAHLLRYGFKGLVVIPGSIGYLHQFFKVNLLVMNVLPGDSPYVINSLQATAVLPGGRDGAYGTADDPLRPTASQGESAALGKPVLGAGANGQLGSGTASLKGGETGAATWYMEGLKEGGHLLQFRIQGEFAGGTLTGPIPITGEARGKVLVRNPKFNTMLIHPDVVRKGEPYPFEVRVTNTSEALANLVTVSLDQARLGSVKVVGEAAKVIETLNPGETRSVTFQMKANRNGEVVSSYLYLEDGSGGFQLSMGLGERQIHLSPDTLVLPQTLDTLPEALREAMLHILGQAHSIATSKAALPVGVLPIRSTTLSGPITTGLNEAGRFLTMGVERRRVWADLWQLFIQNPDPGFDQLVRTTEAGRALRDTLLATHGSWFEPGRGPSGLVAPMASWNDLGASTILGAIEGALPGLQVVMGLPGQVFGQSGEPLPILVAPATAIAT